ncbi:4a-hydroxytetrahydrobiopterin dehydratase [Phaeobacter sp. HF9A]|uniref:4a-hydroxytetrahydrobiopterin dehydratase n=1 Tax=Phaeobacter sp. HF9A TaxID=2721561 RepID=UPI001430386C|nr:4a-hydroxytetrahydrobiopterin dehydratase [Phaeobacter sp. HF9A]NIZ13711.1 4a-hydroxytetrahydrobiopterin dehydratase [Phaeobacter sp. HF9A]
MSDLASSSCAVCDGFGAVLPADRIADLKSRLDPAWTIDAANTSLSRKLLFKGFAKAVYTANLAAFISDKEGHHADVAFGWGYCEITFTSHELGGLSENDFICAAKFDAAIS